MDDRSRSDRLHNQFDPGSWLGPRRYRRGDSPSFRRPPMHRLLALFGGRTLRAADAMGDTWQWDGKAWIQLSTATPPIREGVTGWPSTRGRA